MYKEIMFRPLTRAGELAGRIREMIRYKARALLYIGGNDVLPPPLAKDEEAKLLEEYAKGTIRISFGAENTEEEALAIAEALLGILRK